MGKDVLRFYLLANRLKTVIRSGWMEVEISADRIESVAEHVYGCLVLAIALDSENNLGLDMLKVFKMIIIKEFEKIKLDEVTTRQHLSQEEREKRAVEVFNSVTSSLVKHDEMLGLLEELGAGTKEALFVKQLAKIESDIQAKIYDLEGYFDLDKAKEDAKYYGEPLSSRIIPQMKNASDGWIMYDRQYYTDDMFKDLSQEIQKLK